MQTAWLVPPPTNPIALAAIATGALTGRHCIFDDPVENKRWVVCRQGTIYFHTKESLSKEFSDWDPHLLRIGVTENGPKQHVRFDPAAV